MITFGTKAETLKKILNTNMGAEVLPLFMFTVKEWQKNSQAIWQEIVEIGWDETSLIIRSSAKNEDTNSQSMAGKYTSIVNVLGQNDFCDSVAKVISSYDQIDLDDQVLVQPMLVDVALSGVAFTVDPNTGGNYYIINYDDSTGSTSTVTSGNSKESKLFYYFKDSELPSDKSLQTICKYLAELEKLFGQNNLDVEFAITNKGKFYILQVRPLCVKIEIADLNEQRDNLSRIADKVKYNNSAKPFLYGEKTVFGVMPDWNPAEMIGIRPKPLAMSLYKEIITDNIWAYQRHNYGYKNLRSFPLMVDFCGLPYIDVRVSFNSFIPSNLEASLSEKLTNYYLDRLIESPYKHDKVEFEIIFSCYTLDLPERIKILEQYGFSQEEIHNILDALKSLTNNITNSQNGLWRKDYEKIKVLEQRKKEIMESNLDTVSKIYWLLEDCKRYGTLPFAGLARAAFIAMQILESLVSIEIIDRNEYNDFLNDLTTISSTMRKDFTEMSKKTFLCKYGHLRPGTYDITSPRYDDIPDVYFDWTKESDGSTNVKSVGAFKLSLSQMKKIRGALMNHALTDDVLGLFDFIKFAIEGRKYSKFIFTQNLSEILRLFGKLGQEQDILLEDCAFSDIQVIKELYNSSADKKQIINDSIKCGKVKHAQTGNICLPPLIIDENDIWGFFVPDTQPTYVTLKKANGRVCYTTGEIHEDICGSILLIPCADPGFDWIFSHDIRGFITEYGGANSHMAIRAGELGIPAVIGVGTKMFEELRKVQTLAIDASLRKVNVLK